MAYRLIVNQHGSVRRYPLKEGGTLVGSLADSDITLSHPSVSRRHAILWADGDEARVEDLSSRNGTRVGADRVDTSPLLPGQPIFFGAVEAHLEKVSAGDLEVAVPLEGDQATPDLAGASARSPTWRPGSPTAPGPTRWPSAPARPCSPPSPASP